MNEIIECKNYLGNNTKEALHVTKLIGEVCAEVFNLLNASPVSVDWKDYNASLMVCVHVQPYKAFALPLNGGMKTPRGEIFQFVCIVAKDLMKSRAEQIAPERGRTHGSFADNADFAIMARALMRERPCWVYLSRAQQLALDEIQLKIARLLSGVTAAKTKEHFDDIAGYANLGGKDCV